MISKRDRLQQLKRQVEYVKNLPVTSETNRQVINSSQLNESSFDLNKNELSNIQSEHNEDFNRELEDSALESKTLKEYTSHEYNHVPPSLHIKHPRILKGLDAVPKRPMPARPIPPPPNFSIKNEQNVLSENLQMPKQAEEHFVNEIKHSEELQHTDFVLESNEQLPTPIEIDQGMKMANENFEKIEHVDQVERTSDPKTEALRLIDELAVADNWDMDAPAKPVNEIDELREADQFIVANDPEMIDTTEKPNDVEESPKPQAPTDIHHTSIHSSNFSMPNITTITSIIPAHKPPMPAIPKLVAQKSGFRTVRPPVPIPSMPSTQKDLSKSFIHEEEGFKAENVPSEMNSETHIVQQSEPVLEIIERNEIQVEPDSFKKAETVNLHPEHLASSLKTEAQPQLESEKAELIVEQQPPVLVAPPKAIDEPQHHVDILHDKIPQINLPTVTSINVKDLLEGLSSWNTMISEQNTLRLTNEKLKQQIEILKRDLSSQSKHFNKITAQKEQEITSLLEKLNETTAQNAQLIQEKQFLEDNVAVILEKNQSLYTSYLENIENQNVTVIQKLQARNDDLESENSKLRSELSKQLDQGKDQPTSKQINEVFDSQLGRPFVDEEIVSRVVDTVNFHTKEFDEIFSTAIDKLSSIRFDITELGISRFQSQDQENFDLENLIKKLEVPNLEKLIETLSYFEADLSSKKLQIPDILNIVPFQKVVELRTEVPKIDLPKVVKRDVKDIEELTQGLVNVATPNVPIEVAHPVKPAVAEIKGEVVEKAPEQPNEPSKVDIVEEIKEQIPPVEIKEKPLPLMNKKPLIPKPKQLPILSNANPFGNEDKQVNKQTEEKTIENENTIENMSPNQEDTKKDSLEPVKETVPQETQQTPPPPPPQTKAPQPVEPETTETQAPEPIQPPPKTDISKLIAPPPKNKLLMSKSKVPAVKPMPITPNIPPIPEENGQPVEPEKPIIKSVAKPPVPPEPVTVDSAEDLNQAFFNQLAQSQNVDEQNLGLLNAGNDEALNQESTKTNLSTSNNVFDESFKKRASMPSNEQSTKQQVIDNDTKSEQNYKDNESVEETMSLKSLQLNDLHEYTGKAVKNPFAAKKETKETNIFKKKTINSRNITTGIPDNLF